MPTPTPPIWKREPAAVGTLAMAVLYAAAAFGLDFTADQLGALGVVVMIVFGGAIRQSVWSPASHDEAIRGALDR